MLTGDNEPGPNRSTGALALAVFAACLAVYLPTVSTSFVNTDAGANSLTAWHMAHTGRPWMDGLDLSEPGKVSHYGVGRDGHDVTTRTPGQILAAVPFYLGSPDAQERWSFTRGGIAAAVLTAGCVAMLFLALSSLTRSRRLSLGSTAVFAFTTPVWSVSANALWTHPVTLLGLAGAALALARERWWLVGAWLGVAMTARVHIALIAAVVGLGMAWSRRSGTIAVQVAVPTILALLALSAWGQYVFGSWDPRGAYSNHAIESMVPAVAEGRNYFVNLAGFVVSPDRGILLWTPLLVVLMPAVLRGWRDAPDWTRWLALSGVLYSLAQVGLNVFHGGDVIYGYRLALELLLSVTPLYVACAGQVGRLARSLAPMVIGVQAAAIFLGSFIETLSLPESEVWSDNALVRALVDYPVGLGGAFLVIALVVAVGTRQLIPATRPERTRRPPDGSRFGRSTAPPSRAG